MRDTISCRTSCHRASLSSRSLPLRRDTRQGSPGFAGRLPRSAAPSCRRGPRPRRMRAQQPPVGHDHGCALINRLLRPAQHRVIARRQRHDHVGIRDRPPYAPSARKPVSVRLAGIGGAPAGTCAGYPSRENARPAAGGRRHDLGNRFVGIERADDRDAKRRRAGTARPPEAHRHVRHERTRVLRQPDVVGQVLVGTIVVDARRHNAR